MATTPRCIHKLSQDTGHLKVCLIEYTPKANPAITRSIGSLRPKPEFCKWQSTSVTGLSYIMSVCLKNVLINLLFHAERMKTGPRCELTNSFLSWQQLDKPTWVQINMLLTTRSKTFRMSASSLRLLSSLRAKKNPRLHGYTLKPFKPTCKALLILAGRGRKQLK